MSGFRRKCPTEASSSLRSMSLFPLLKLKQGARVGQAGADSSEPRGHAVFSSASLLRSCNKKAPTFLNEKMTSLELPLWVTRCPPLSFGQSCNRLTHQWLQRYAAVAYQRVANITWSIRLRWRIQMGNALRTIAYKSTT